MHHRPVVQQDSRRFGSNAVEAKDRLFAKLGLEHSSWVEGGLSQLWRTVLPSVVAADPKFIGDQDAFCEAYSKGEYAPDLVKWEGDL